jgi:UDP-N-acetylmuramyl pentapeptide synthase
VQTILNTLFDIALIINAKCIGSQNTEANFQLLIDSRTLTSPENTIFFALKTPYNDGHKYIGELIKKGVKYFVVDQESYIKEDQNLSFLLVENTLSALQNLSAHHRQNFNFPIIG